MNFLPEPGYDVALEIFTSLGLPIRDRNLPTDPLIPRFSQPASQAFYQNLSPSHSQEFLTPSHIRGPISSAPEMYTERQDNVPMVFNSKMPSKLLVSHPPEKLKFYDNRPAYAPPNTSAELCDAAPSSLSQMLPPRRVLPFPQKKPKPTTPEPEEDSPSPKEAVAAKDSNTLIAKPRARRVKKRAKITSKVLNLPESADKSPMPKTKARPNAISPISLSSPKAPQTQITSKINSNKTNKSVSTADPSASSPHIAQPTNRLDSVEPAEFMSRLDTWVRRYHDLPAPKPREAAGMNDLAAYAAQPKEDRLKVLDDMICECLEDENFVTLVTDVEESWRRIGLGF